MATGLPSAAILGGSVSWSDIATTSMKGMEVNAAITTTSDIGFIVMVGYEH